MPSITFDGQSFMLDGRRVWLVSGAIHAARVPRAYWADRIHAAKNAGLNCIETPVIWARHEARQGHFDFTGENDIRHFIQLVGQAGMYCILRAGPFVNAGWDLGGLPPWLLSNEAMKLRTANQPFLEACSRYITALAGQIRDLQVNSPTPRGQASAGGPIIMVQNENTWTCGDDVLAQGYLGELDRYFREAGINVPIINSNQLWQSVEGEIDGWSGFDGLLAHLRQLGSIRSNQPRIVIDFQLGRRRVWGHPAEPAVTPGVALRRLAEVLAAGGQFNIEPFHGGTNFGFAGGRDPELGADGFVTTSNDSGAPLNELGQPSASYWTIRRLCTFASRFGRVFAHLDPSRQAVAVLPETHMASKGGAAPAVSARASVVHASGSQGGIAFVFGDDTGANAREPLTLLLADGSTLPVELGDQSVVWCLLDTRLTGRAHLNYCNLCAFAVVGKVFVCFGAPGSRAMLSINGAPLETVVPESKAASPVVVEHEGLTIVIANHEQIDELVAEDGAGVLIGVAGMDRHNTPLLSEGRKQYTKIDAEGVSSVVKPAHPAHALRQRGKATLGEWSLAAMQDYADGSSPRFASIVKPADLMALGAPYGYGWYRIKFSSGSTRKATLMFPHAGHRLHLTLDGEPAGLVGIGPGAASLASLGLKKGSHTLVVLAENFGRSSAGTDLGEPVGLYGHAWEVEAMRFGKPKLVASDPVDLLAFRAPLWRLHRDDVSDAQRLTWKFDHRRKTGIIVQINALDLPAGVRHDGLVLLNGKPIHYFQQGGVRPLFIEPALLSKGTNELQITMVGPTAQAADALTSGVKFFEAVDSPTGGMGGKAEWAFAKWEPPSGEAFGKVTRSHPGGVWWRCGFNAGESDAPLLLDCAGLSKGQIYVNGRHVGRYFVSTATGKKVPPQTKYVIPRSYLSADGSDELMVFDEHGAAPTRCKLIADSAVSVIGE